MTAIAGIIHFDGEPVARQDLERMGQALERFGRDAQKVSMGSGAGFVIRRALVTPEDRFDRQPLVNGGHDVFLFEGRLDNRADVIRRLGLTDTAARLMADSDLASQAWSRWGRDCLIHLVGVFNAGHWHTQDRRLVLACSAPLSRGWYVHRQGRRLYFATAPQGLFALSQVPRELDETAMRDLIVGNAGSSRSLFHGIHRVFTAHWSEYSSGGQETRRYWKPDRGRRLRFKREEEGWEAVNACLDEVVQSQLRSIRPVGVMMSGGLDSAAIAGLTADNLARRGQTLLGYTRVASPGAPLRRNNALWYSDERSRAEQIARMHPNLRHQMVHSGNEPVMASLISNFAATSSTRIASATLATCDNALFRKAAADGVGVLLSGAVGNSTISYDGIGRLRTLFRSGRWVTLWRELGGMRRFRGEIEDVVREELLDEPFFNGLRTLRRRFRGLAPETAKLSSFFNEAFAAQDDALARGKAIDTPAMQWHKLDSWGRRAWLFGMDGAGGAELLMAEHGMEGRAPFADRRVVELVLSLPDEFFLKDGIDRRLVRLGLAHLIPEAIRLDPSRGRPEEDWAFRMHRDRAAIAAALADLSEDTSVGKYLDVKAMQAGWRDFQAVDWSVAPMKDEIRCHYQLMEALTIGSFVRWFERRN